MGIDFAEELLQRLDPASRAADRADWDQAFATRLLARLGHIVSPPDPGPAIEPFYSRWIRKLALTRVVEIGCDS
ncbi:hypothetical protein [Sphingomonas sp. DBB INV C78]|uniref:hypothetical protein n=1 Tax=Sphingomonas sp. DBB INV C78 TaxID=3349434 RepID=UPI0036D27E20